MKDEETLQAGALVGLTRQEFSVLKQLKPNFIQFIKQVSNLIDRVFLSEIVEPFTLHNKVS